MRPACDISEYLPPHLREALVQAAERGDLARIEQLTDLAGLTYPELVLPRDTVRQQFVPLDRIDLHAAGDYSQRQLGAQFGVNSETIGSIVRRESWRHL